MNLFIMEDHVDMRNKVPCDLYFRIKTSMKEVASHEMVQAEFVETHSQCFGCEQFT
jgi:hypothetical protein